MQGSSFQISASQGAGNCPICQEEPAEATINCCSHRFCFGCIEKWSLNKKTCPLCRKRFRAIYFDRQRIVLSRQTEEKRFGGGTQFRGGFSNRPRYIPPQLYLVPVQIICPLTGAVQIYACLYLAFGHFASNIYSLEQS